MTDGMVVGQAPEAARNRNPGAVDANKKLPFVHLCNHKPRPTVKTLTCLSRLRLERLLAFSMESQFCSLSVRSFNRLREPGPDPALAIRVRSRFGLIEGARDETQSKRGLARRCENRQGITIHRADCLGEHASHHRRDNKAEILSMNPGLIAGLAAVSGSIVGALGSVVGTWISTRHQDLRDLLAKTIVRREALYSDFITESARLLVDAMEHNTSDPQKLIPAYALLSRIRLSSSSSVLAKAEEVIKTILSTYPQPNLTVEQIEFRAVNGEDPLRQFSNTCRAELESMQKQL